MSYDREALIDTIHTGLCGSEHNDPCTYPTCTCPGPMRSEYRREAAAVIVALEAGGWSVRAPNTRP